MRAREVRSLDDPEDQPLAWRQGLNLCILLSWRRAGIFGPWLPSLQRRLLGPACDAIFLFCHIHDRFGLQKAQVSVWRVGMDEQGRQILEFVPGPTWTDNVTHSQIDFAVSVLSSERYTRLPFHFRSLRELNYISAMNGTSTI